jgi:hypothetical protein
MTNYNPEVRYPGSLPARTAVLSVLLFACGLIGSIFVPFLFFLSIIGYFLLLFSYVFYAANIFEIGGKYTVVAILSLAIPFLGVLLYTGSFPTGFGEILGVFLGVVVILAVSLWTIVKVKQGVFQLKPANGLPNLGFVALSTISLWLIFALVLGLFATDYPGLAHGIPWGGSGGPQAVTVTMPVPSYPRPATGTFFTGRYQSGSFGDIVLDNQAGANDAVISLISRDRKIPDISVYVRKGDIFTVTSVLSSTYDGYITMGENWNRSGKKFTIGAKYFRITSPVKFEAHGSVEGNQEVTHYVDWRFTLVGSLENETGVVAIDGQDFPRI